LEHGLLALGVKGMRKQVPGENSRSAVESAVAQRKHQSRRRFRKKGSNGGKLAGGLPATAWGEYEGFHEDRQNEGFGHDERISIRKGRTPLVKKNSLLGMRKGNTKTGGGMEAKKKTNRQSKGGVMYRIPSGRWAVHKKERGTGAKKRSNNIPFQGPGKEWEIYGETDKKKGSGKPGRYWQGVTFWGGNRIKYRLNNSG